MKRQSFFFLVSLITAFISPPPVAGEVSRSDGHIILEKKNSHPGDTGRESSTSSFISHIVEPGETLSKILLDAGASSRDLPELVSLTRRLNPEMSDLNMIFPGQKISIPYIAGGGARAFFLTDEERSAAEVQTEMAIDGDEEKDDPRTDYRKAVEVLVTAIEEEISSSGSLSLPLSSGGSVALDNSAYPLLLLSNGKRLLLDMEGRMPDRWKDIIEGSWAGYSVVTVPAGSSLKNVVGNILEKSGFYSVSTNETISLGRNSGVRISADFLLEKTKDSLLDDQLYAINIISGIEQGLPVEIVEMAGEHRIKIVEAGAGADRGDKSVSDRRMILARKIAASDVEILLSEIAYELGLKVERNISRRLSAGDDDAFSVDLEVDLHVEKSGLTWMVCFGDVEAWVADTVQGRRGSLLLAGGDPQAEDLIRKMLEWFNFKYFGPEVEFFRSSGEVDGNEERFRIKVPGFYVTIGERHLLLTGGSISPSVQLFLLRSGIDILRYQLI